MIDQRPHNEEDNFFVFQFFRVENFDCTIDLKQVLIIIFMRKREMSKKKLFFNISTQQISICNFDK